MLTTVERLKSMAHIAEGAATDDDLRLQIIVASQQIESRCKRSFRKQVYQERVSGDSRSKYLNVRNYPVYDVLLLESEAGSIAEYEILDEGRLFRKSGWPSGEHNLSITYEGGYVLPGDDTPDNPRTLPEALEYACILLVQHLQRRPGVKSERVGDISVTYSDEETDLPAPVLALITPFVGNWV
jgi:hypothetical protein